LLERVKVSHFNWLALMLFQII